MKNTMTKGEIRHELAKAKKELKDAWICGEGYDYDQNFIVCYKDGTVLETREANERLPQTGIIGIQFFGTDGHYTVGYEMYNGEKVLIEDESEDACYRVEYLPLTSTEATAETVESVEETTVSETVEETAEQETELNAEVAEVEAEQTAETETISKSESESEPTVDSNTVETYQGNINVLIVADIANTFEMITHTGYFDTS